MTYTKPSDITYTQMCMYIDENIYNNSFDETTVYQYLYHIILMLAKQAQLFSKHCYYDPFALYGATRVYFRLTNKKQWQPNKDNTGYKMQRIKSVLNYIKNVLYYLKVDFEQEEYAQTLKVVEPQECGIDYSRIIPNSVDSLCLLDFESTLGNVHRTCDKFLSTLPYKKGTTEWLNIYISVMLSFLDSVTLTQNQTKRIEHLEGTGRLKDTHIENFYAANRTSSPILFHLPKSMENYITVLTRQLRHIVASDLSDILHTKITQDIELIDYQSKNYVKECDGAQHEY